MPLSPASRWAGRTAVAAVVLFSVANALWGFEQPAPDASAATIVAFYEGASTRIVLGGLLSLTSIGIFVAFGCALRRALVDHWSGELLADLAFAGALLGAAPGLGAETVNAAAALRAGDGALTDDVAVALFDVSYVLGSYAAGPGFGLLALAVSAAALRNPVLLPRWLAWAGLVLGALTFTSVSALVIGEYTVVPVFLLMAVVGIRLLRQ